MKKIKELLFFVVPIIFLFFVPVLLFIFAPDPALGYPKLVGNAKYLEMFFKDDIFLKSIFNSFCLPIVISFCAVLFFNIINRIKNLLNKFLIKYLINISISSIISFIIFICTKYSYLQSVVYSLRVAILIALLFWIVDFIFKNKDNGKYN